MKHFGTVQSFNDASGHGIIKPENGGRDLGFERSSMLCHPMVSPRRGLRLSYHLSGKNGRASAVNVQSTLPKPSVSALKPLSIFRSAAEEAATHAEFDEWDNEGGRIRPTEGRVVGTPRSGGEMTYYRLYCVGGDGKIVAGEWLEARTDEDAVMIADSRRPTSQCELWDHTRMVARLHPQPTQPSFAPAVSG